MVTLEEFKELHGQLSQRDKDRLAKSDIIMYNESDVENVMSFMRFMVAINKLNSLFSKPKAEEDVPPP